MGLDALGRMIIAPAAVAVAVGILLRRLGSAAVLIGFAILLVAQLAVFARSHWQLEIARRRLAASRRRRARLRLRRPTGGGSSRVESGSGQTMGKARPRSCHVIHHRGSGPVEFSHETMLVAVDGDPAGVIGIADKVKDTTPDALAALSAQGIEVIMLTGDNQVTAEAVARDLGIEHVEAEVLPDRKSDVVNRLRSEGRVVAFAGDGVNDAPALAAADVGLAMSSGTDVAIESASVTLLRGDLNGIAHARRLSHATMQNIRGNLWFAFGYNAVGIPIAAGVLYPAFGILLNPMIAALAMALSSVSVIGNALRLRKVRL
jgi:Cu+-exporting ATPase